MIGYPNKAKKTTTLKNKKNTIGGRGMSLEHDLNASNAYYRSINKCVIYKKPTPVQVVKVDYPKRSSAKIVEAYYKTPSTTDYNGVYRNRYIDFEAKETLSKTSFTFRSIHPHQIDHLAQILQHGGIGFFIIRFSSHDETYLIDADIIIERYRHAKRQSISYEEIKEKGFCIRRGLTPRLHYLEIVDTLYF